MPDNKGYIYRNRGGYIGSLAIDGVDISPISGVYFKDNGLHWLWLRRKRILEYNIETGEYWSKTPMPNFEAYLVKQKNGSSVDYKGEFIFFRFKYSIVGIWDSQEKGKERLNLYVERLPQSKQNIINGLSKKVKNK